MCTIEPSVTEMDAEDASLSVSASAASASTGGVRGATSPGRGPVRRSTPAAGSTRTVALAVPPVLVLQEKVSQHALQCFLRGDHDLALQEAGVDVMRVHAMLDAWRHGGGVARYLPSKDWELGRLYASHNMMQHWPRVMRELLIGGGAWQLDLANAFPTLLHAWFWIRFPLRREEVEYAGRLVSQRRFVLEDVVNETRRLRGPQVTASSSSSSASSSSSYEASRAMDAEEAVTESRAVTKAERTDAKQEVLRVLGGAAAGAHIVLAELKRQFALIVQAAWVHTDWVQARSKVTAHGGSMPSFGAHVCQTLERTVMDAIRVALTDAGRTIRVSVFDALIFDKLPGELLLSGELTNACGRAALRMLSPTDDLKDAGFHPTFTITSVESSLAVEMAPGVADEPCMTPLRPSDKRLLFTETGAHASTSSFTAAPTDTTIVAGGGGGGRRRAALGSGTSVTSATASEFAELHRLEAWTALRTRFEGTAFYHAPSNTFGWYTERSGLTYLKIVHAYELINTLYTLPAPYADIPFMTVWRADLSRRIVYDVGFCVSADDPSVFRVPIVFQFDRFTRAPGFVEPTPAQSDAAVALFVDLIRGASGDAPPLTSYLTSYLAHTIQKPTERPDVCVVLTGKKGVGKDTLVEVFFNILGDALSHIYTSCDQFFDRFDTERENRMALCISDTDAASFSKNSKTFRAMITSKKLTVNPKGLSARSFDNVLRFFATSNEAVAINQNEDGQKERRLVVMASIPDREDAVEFFNQVYHKETGLYTPTAAVCLGRWLRDYPLGDFAPHILPVNEHQDLLFEMERTVEQRFIEDVWDGRRVLAADLRLDFKTFCEGEGERDYKMAMTANAFGRMVTTFELHGVVELTQGAGRKRYMCRVKPPPRDAEDPAT